MTKASVARSRSVIRKFFVSRSRFAMTPWPDLSSGESATPTEPEASCGQDKRDYHENLINRLMYVGGDSCTDCELLEMLAFLTTGKKVSKAFSRFWINKFGGYGNLISADSASLTAAGLGRSMVKTIEFARFNALFSLRKKLYEGPLLARWDHLVLYLHAVMSRNRIEQFRIFFLDKFGCLITEEIQGEGTINHVPVYQREVVKRALQLQAASIIVSHNHPGGDPTPSMPDLDMTNIIFANLKQFDIALIDHIIIGGARYTSLRHEGFL